MSDWKREGAMSCASRFATRSGDAFASALASLAFLDLELCGPFCRRSAWPSVCSLARRMKSASLETILAMENPLHRWTALRRPTKAARTTGDRSFTRSATLGSIVSIAGWDFGFSRIQLKPSATAARTTGAFLSCAHLLERIDRSSAVSPGGMMSQYVLRIMHTALQPTRRTGSLGSSRVSRRRRSCLLSSCSRSATFKSFGHSAKVYCRSRAAFSRTCQFATFRHRQRSGP
mmetsp:Transcript_95171/g.284189  ORF Transcript_95171/g.284189 Transcript_95171/m.284189 type:complete len:232 (+) Transcript_95171:583-1278(+)